MIGKEDSLALFVFTLVNVVVPLVVISIHRINPHKHYVYKLDSGSWAIGFYKLSFFWYLVLCLLLAAGGYLNYETNNWDNTNRTAGWWTYAAGQIVLLAITLPLIYINESIGFGMAGLIVSGALFIISSVFVLNYSEDSSQSTAFGLLLAAGFLCLVYFILHWSLSSNDIEEHHNTNQKEMTPLLPTGSARPSRSGRAPSRGRESSHA